MAEKTMPTLKSCSHQYSEANGDRLSKLPFDILLLILSSLPMKESVRTCVLSHKWKDKWKYLRALFFQDEYSTTELLRDDLQLISPRSGFMRWVDGVVEAHLGLSIDDFMVNFDLDVHNLLTIDKWLVFALSKQVKSLELNFTPCYRIAALDDCYTWPLENRCSTLGLHRNLAFLRSLCLKYVNISNEDIKHIFLSCHDLESLCVVSGSEHFTEIKFPHAPLQLKHLEVAHLSFLRQFLCIDILTPKLVSFKYHGCPIALNIRDASLLSEVSLGNGVYVGEVVADAYASLSKYFSQLTSLNWNLVMNPQLNDRCIKWNLGIKNPPAMTNLKHLELHVKPWCDESLLGWVSLIEASPVLQSLTVKVSGTGRRYGVHDRNIVKIKAQPLKSLKMLELVNFVGLPVEIEFANFIVQNSVRLEKVIRVFTESSFVSIPFEIYRRSIDLVKEFKSTLPPETVYKTRRDCGTPEREGDLYDI